MGNPARKSGVIQRLVVLGTGGNTLDVMDIVAVINAREQSWDLVGVLDDATPVGPHPIGLRNFGRLADAATLGAPGGPLAGTLFVNAIGSPSSHAARAGLVERTGVPSERFAVLMHPMASISAQATLGRGCCVNFGASIAGRVQLGDHAWVGPGCILGHDAILEAHAVMAPGSIVSGSVRLGAGCYLGSGAIVRQGVRVGTGALVGMGAIVLRDMAPGSVVAGNPARELHRS